METQISSLDEFEASGRTLVFDDPKSVALTLEAGETIPPHEHPGETVLFHVLAGELALTLRDETHELGAGDIVRFSGDQNISPSATTDARALLVFVPRD